MSDRAPRHSRVSSPREVVEVNLAAGSGGRSERSSHSAESKVVPQ